MAAKCPYIECQLGNRKRKVLYDTGASANIMSFETFQQCQEAGQLIHKLAGHRFRITAANGQAMRPIGVFLMSITIGPRQYTGPFAVVDGLDAPAIIGIKAIKDCRISFDSP